MVTVLGWFIAVSVTAALVFGVAEVGEAAIDDAQAATAADAAALAGAAAGPAAAAEAARRNGAVLVSVTVEGANTRVVVAVERARASATAERIEIIERPS